MSEVTQYESHPAMFRNRPFEFTLCVALSFVGIGLIIFLVWWIQIKGTKLTVTNTRTILRRGLFSKHINEVYHSDIRNVQIYQNLLQRILKVGTISIASAGSGQAEIVVQGMPHPEQVKSLLDQGRREKRTAE